MLNYWEFVREARTGRVQRPAWKCRGDWTSLELYAAYVIVFHDNAWLVVEFYAEMLRLCEKSEPSGDDGTVA